MKTPEGPVWQEVIDYDPYSGVRTDYWTNGKEWGFYTEQDMRAVKALAETAKSLREDDSYKARGIKNDLLHVARVPEWVHAKLINEYGIKHPLQQGEECLKIIQRDFPWCMTSKGRY